jgi:hypothetical protein
MAVGGQIFRRIEKPQESLPAHARGQFPGLIPRRRVLVPGALVQGPDRFFALSHVVEAEPLDRLGIGSWRLRNGPRTGCSGMSSTWANASGET